MKKIYVLFFSLMLMASVSNAADRYAVANGNWNSASTWSATSGGPSGATAPVAGDNVFIEGGFTVTITADAACANLTVSSGTLTIGNSGGDDLAVTGNISISSGATIQAGDDGVLTLGGSITNNGTLNLNNGADDTDVVFNGSSNQTVSGTGATTDFNLITINNSGAANNNIVEITSTNFTVVSGFLTLTDGFFKLSTGASVTFATGSYTIPANTGVHLNHSGATIGVGTTAGSLTLNGTLIVDLGTLNVGAGQNQLNVAVAGSVATFSGGTININGRLTLTNGTTTINGASINIDPQGSAGNLSGNSHIFEAVGNASLTFSSGTVTIIDPHAGTGTGNAVQMVSGAGTKNLTGSTIRLGDGTSTSSGSADGFDVNGGVALGSLIVNNPSGTNRTAFYVTNSPTFSGSVTITAGTLNVGTFNQSIGGNWSNSGTFTTGAQTTTFNGSGPQTIGGSNPTAFSSLTINNSSVSGVTLNQDISVAGTMTFTDGIVTSSATNILTINDNATVSGASNASYVDGPMIKLGNDNFTFPVGDPLGSYHPIRLNNTVAANASAATTDSYNAEYFRAGALTRNSSIIATGSGLYGVSFCEHWSLNRTSGSGAPDVAVSWTADSPCNSNGYITQTTGLVLAWLDLSNEWQQAAGGGVTNTGDATAGESMQTDVSQFGYFALGNTAPEHNPLPVKIGGIKAYEKANGVQIDWTAFTEINVSKYIIERSIDGINFSPVGDVMALNSANETKYGFFDASPNAGINFYRIRNLDMDGKSGYSNILRVNLAGGNKEVTVYPNPVRGGGYLSYSASQLAKGNYSLRIFNAAGQQVFVQKFSHNGGAINQTLQLPAAVKSGLYTLQLDNEGAKVAGKTFMVQ